MVWLVCLLSSLLVLCLLVCWLLVVAVVVEAYIFYLYQIQTSLRIPLPCEIYPASEIYLTY